MITFLKSIFPYSILVTFPDFVTFWQKDIGKKRARKMLVKLTLEGAGPWQKVHIELDM
jgi:hypothetical protein